MKVKFVANYDSDINIYKSIINSFCSSEEDVNMLTFQEDYDYLGIFNGYSGKIEKTCEWFKENYHFARGM